MMHSGYALHDLVREAHTRWLKPAEVLFILQNHEDHQLTQEPPQKPLSGSLFLFNKRVLRFFRRDGLSWRKKKDGRTVGEAHERLKVGNVEALNCYYAHGEQNPNFQRRSYWMLDPVYEHIVLVHYRDISEGSRNSGTISQLSAGSSSAFSLSPDLYIAQNPGSTSVISDVHEAYQNHSSPGSVEVSSKVVIKNNGQNHVDSLNGTVEFSSSPELEVTHALRKLEEQLSLDDDSLKEISPLCSENQNSDNLGVLTLRRLEQQLSLNNDSFQEISPSCRENENLEDLEVLGYERKVVMQDGYVQGQQYTGSRNIVLLQDAGGNGLQDYQSVGHKDSVESKDFKSWKEMLELSKNPPAVESQEKRLYTSARDEISLSFSRRGMSEERKKDPWLNFGRNNPENSSVLLPQEFEYSKLPVYSSLINTQTTSSGYTMLFEQGPMEIPVEADSSLTIAQKQKFKIREISPEWGYATEVTKVLIIGSFLCDPLECEWSCMIGDTEVPLQFIQEGVICCQAPPHLPGKYTLCITSGNRESCSEVREFEYRVNPSSCAHCNLPQMEATKSPEELLLLARFVQMLLSDPQMLKGDNVETGIDLLIKCKANDDSWSHVIEGFLFDNGNSCSTMDWLLQELLKDKLQQWLSSRSQEGDNQLGCSLSKKEQGIIHMAAGLGFEWALIPILRYGVSINFRDFNGWTALHWAARYGREKMIAALIASGASAWAVTDPSPQDPTGKTPASIAAMSGHKGLAGYLSELALTGHLSSLTLEESELSKGSADMEAEIAVNNITKGKLSMSEDQLSLKDTLAAVRNAAQAAARIQSAFRAHSFRRRQQKESASIDEYGICSSEIQGISAASKLVFGNTAALSIQKKYRGWKGRKDFLDLRRKVVKIQAHVRGHQVRKDYKVIWAVGILEKVILRWRRRGVGLRGFRPESESINESEDEDDDILKVFRRQKVDVAIDEAVSRVLSMVDSSEARQQYRRMLETYRLAKAKLSTANEEESISLDDICNMENKYQYP